MSIAVLGQLLLAIARAYWRIRLRSESRTTLCVVLDLTEEYRDAPAELQKMRRQRRRPGIGDEEVLVNTICALNKLDLLFFW